MNNVLKTMPRRVLSHLGDISTKRLTMGVVLLAFMVMGPLLRTDVAMGYALNYANNTMYFSGHTMSGWTPPPGVSAVNPLYVAGQFPDGSTEPGVNGSSGFVIPNKASTLALPGDASDAGGAGGATGFDALGLVNDGGANMRDDPQRKQKLYDLLYSLNQSGTDWEKMGSAFVVYKMIQRTPSGGPWIGASHTVSPADWQEFQDRFLSNSNITMTYDPSYSVLDRPNTNSVEYLEGGVWKYDIIDNILEENDPGNDSAVQPAWIFRDAGDSNNIVFVLEVNCANPMDNFAGLADFDPPQLDLELTKLVDGNDDGVFAKSEQIQAGVPFSYEVTLENVSTVQATGVEVRDQLPSGVTLLSTSMSQGATTPSSGSAPLVNWTVGTVAPGATHTLTLRVVVHEADLPAYRSALVAGISRNLAEISAANETDIDSTPGNIDTPYVPANREDDEDHADVHMLSALGDCVWIDYNNNGKQDDGEPGLSGVTVRLLDENDAVIDTTVTQENAGCGGYYMFGNLTPGVPYKVQFVAPDGYMPSPMNADGVDAAEDSDADKVTGMTRLITLAPGEFNPTIDAGFTVLAPNTGAKLMNTSAFSLAGICAVLAVAGLGVYRYKLAR